MIFCFSGCGNTMYAARMLASSIGETIVRIGDETPSGFDISQQKRVIWMFPVHSWGVPPVVRRFIRNVNLEKFSSGTPHFMVATCGDDCGLTHKMWRRDIMRRGWTARAAFTLTMPNTYVLLPGFDVDSPEVELSKMERVQGHVTAIAHAIKCNSRLDQVVAGRLPWLKTKIIYPLFMRFLTSPKPFHTLGSCTGCGACVRQCPMHNISLTPGNRPQWGVNCAACLGCYHVCPHHAVAYGRRTKGKGQWIAPGRPIER